MSEATKESDDSTGLGGKYLTFSLGAEDYALSILNVQEIIGMMDVTMVPGVPDYVRGVINLRGKIVPVIDLRTRFSMERAERTDETCIIVVDGSAGEVGVVVDRVSEVLDILGRDIDPPPTFAASVTTAYLLGIGKAAGRVQLVLDIERVLGGDLADLGALGGAA